MSATAGTDDPLLKEIHTMNIKEITIKELLTTTDSYSTIVETIRESHPETKSTVKCVAFYASQLRKIDKECLAHRKTANTAGSSLAAMIAKYSVTDETMIEPVVEVVEVVEVVVPKTKHSRKAA